MEKEKIKNSLDNYRKRYNELYQYVFVDNFNNTRGCEFFREIEFLGNEIQFLDRLLRYNK